MTATILVKREKRPKRTPTWVPVFLRALADSGNVRVSCTRARITTGNAYTRRAKDPWFDSQWEAALEDFTQLLEAEATRRAMSTSDPLMMFLLKARRPEVYRERYEYSGPNGGPIRLAAVSDEELDRRIAAQLNGRALPERTNGFHPESVEN